MAREELKVPKQENEVTLWVHPEGRVVGTIFLSYRYESMRPLEPVEVLNQESHFLVLRGASDADIRFYSKAAIVRVDYAEPVPESAPEPLACRLHLMDGALVEGAIHRDLPPDQARLYDYLNLEQERFVKLHVGPSAVCLVNKSYIVRADPA